jgi:apolipoprotein N-acyltransferase
MEERFMEATVEVREGMAKPQPAPAGYVFQPAPRSLYCPRLLAALLSSGLMYLSFYPLAWGWLAWVALVPLLCLVRSDARPRNIYFAAWLGGLAFFWPVLQWMRVADYRMYFCWALLATYCSSYLPVAVWLLRRLDRRTSLPLVITVPAVWVGLEYLRSFLLTGFPWYYLGHSQHNLLPLIQIADLTGVYGVSCLVAAANAWAFEMLYAQPLFRGLLQLREPACVPPPPEQTQTQPNQAANGNRGLAFQGFSIFVLVAAALFYGFWRMDKGHFETGPRIALLQANVDQRLRNNADVDRRVASQAVRDYEYLSAIAVRQSQKPHLVIWPETSFPYPWFDVSRVSADKLRPDWADEAIAIEKLLRTWVKTWSAEYLFGMNSIVLNEAGEEVRYNSALVVKPEGTVGERYDKVHRLPFGEYVPLLDWLPFMKRFAPYDHDYSIRSGEQQTRFNLGDYRYGVLICYEDTDPVLARQLVTDTEDGPPADFIINMSNESWFDDTCEHEEHLALCRFRAIECRRTMARAVNMGISAVIDGNGRVLEPRSAWQKFPAKAGAKGPATSREYQVWDISPQDGEVPELPPARWADFKKVPGVLSATIPIDRRTSLYARFGDWLPQAAWIVLGFGLIAPYVARRKRAEPLAG